MAGSNQESYWRIYLLLHQGSPLIFKQLVVREIEKCGGDIDSLLFDYKSKLCANLSTLDVKILFPESQKTDIDKWNTDIFPCVLLTLFSKTLQQVEKQLIRRIQNVESDIEELPAMSLDCDAFDDLEQTLSKTLHKLAVVSNEREMVTNIDELLQVFLKQPLNVVDLLGKITKFGMPNKTRQKFKVFLEARVTEENKSTNKSEGTLDTSVEKEDGSLDEHGPNITVEAQNDLEKIPKLEDAARGSDDIGCDSEDVTKHDLEDVTRIIVQNDGGGLTEQEAESTRLLLQTKDLGEKISVKRVDDMANDTLQDWENVKVKVAVLGRTGVGKSRFINAIRGCTADEDPLYAKVGSIETTTKAECYPHPKNKQLELYDLPGIGTDTLTSANFIDDERINFHSYDIYIIMSSDRFTKDETFFAEQVERSGKKFLFVRSRVDINLDGVRDIQAELYKIRANCEKKLKDTSMKEKDVFLISSKEPENQLLDFDRLLERLVYSLSGLKQEAMMFSLQFNTKKFIDDKEKALEARTLVVGMKSAAGGAVPIPGVSLVCDIVLVTKELNFYRSTLGVTDNDLKDLGEKTKTDVDELKRKYELKSFDVCTKTSMAFNNPGRQIVTIFQTLALSEAVESSVKILPVIGSVMGAGVSFATTTLFLRSNLKMIAEDARKMMDILVKETGIKISGGK